MHDRLAFVIIVVTENNDFTEISRRQICGQVLYIHTQANRLRYGYISYSHNVSGTD